MADRWTCKEVIERLKSLGDPEAVAGAARFGIHVSGILGVSAPNLRKLAKEIDSRPARWIAADALRELTSDKVQARLA